MYQPKQDATQGQYLFIKNGKLSASIRNLDTVFSNCTRCLNLIEALSFSIFFLQHNIESFLDQLMLQSNEELIIICDKSCNQRLQFPF